MSDKTPLASESSHWYEKDGTPRYEIPRADGKGMRPTTLADARKLDLVPSVTLILRCAAQPGLEAWKATQLLQSALTLPQPEGETLDDYAKRVIEDSKEQGRKAAERGTELHAAIETFIAGEIVGWRDHLRNLDLTLKQYGIDIFKGKPEHSFASLLGYGGKIDWHNDEIIIDFKTKKDLSAKRLAYEENCWQLAAYATGVFSVSQGLGRQINVFIGIDDCEVRIHEWSTDDASWGWGCFERLLAFWNLKNKFGGTK